jgi:hypothetical protein
MLSLTFESGTKRLSTSAEQSAGETSACVSVVVPCVSSAELESSPPQAAAATAKNASPTAHQARARLLVVVPAP